MNTPKPDGKPLELELVEIETDVADPSRGTGTPTQTKSLGITNADPFLEEAAREYQSGKIDKALWTRAQSIAGDDESIVIAAYLRARASMLERDKRNARAARPEGPPTGSPSSRREGPPTGTRTAQGSATATRGSRSQGPATRSRDDRSSDGGRTPPPRAGMARVPRNVIYLGAAAAGLSFVGVMLWVLAAPASTESARQAVTAAAVKRTEAPARPAPTVASPAAPAPSAEPSLADKVAEMKRTGNWNVLVLNATEWTRKEPANAAAWRELSIGYSHLRQLDEARDAAMRAVTLAPTDAEAWRGLGRVNVALERWPDAGAAFEKALAVRADDPDALCGVAVVARREGRFKDADAIVKRIGDDTACRGLGESESVAVVPRGGTTRR